MSGHTEPAPELVERAKHLIKLFDDDKLYPEPVPEPVWNGKLSDAMQKALNALHLECPPAVVSAIAFQVRQECEAIYTSYITVKRMYNAARDELDARYTKDEELKSALAEPAPEPVGFDAAFDTVNWDAWRHRPIRELVRELHKVTTPAPTPEKKGLFVDLIAKHPGLTKELAAMGAPAPVPLLTDDEILDAGIASGWRARYMNKSESDFAREIEQAVRQKAGL